MDDPDEENIESSWIMINSVDMAEEATILDSGGFLDESQTKKNHDGIESDLESDGISIISESSHLHDGSNEDETYFIDEDIPNATDKDQSSVDNSTKSALHVKTNWTFVDSEISPPKLASSHQFYLNCLQEPVQELSEHELGSIQSDLDSDGISIISDCDSLNEYLDDDNKLVEGAVVNENHNNENTELASKLPPGIKKYCNGVLIGTILLATSSIFLGQYFNSTDQIEDDLPIYKEEINSDLEEKLPQKINDFNEKYEVPTALAYCQEQHKSDGIFMEHNVKKCLKKIEKRIKRKKENALKEEEITKIKKYLIVKEQYLEEKEKFLIKREYELIKAEMNLKNQRIRQLKRTGIKEKKKPNENIDDSVTNKNDEVIDETQVNDFNYKIGTGSNINVIKNNYKDKKPKYFASHIKFEKHKKNYFKMYHKNKHHPNKYGKDEYEEINRKEKFSNKFNKDEKNMRSRKNKNEAVKVTKPKPEAFKYSKTDNNLQFEDTYEKHEKIKDKRIGGTTNYIVLENNNNETISGYWVGKLYKGRSDLRNKRHSGDWYFDRASYRKTKRDKAKWYFDWMTDREMLRYRRSYYM